MTVLRPTGGPTDRHRFRRSRRRGPPKTFPRKLEGWSLLAVIVVGLVLSLLPVWRERFSRPEAGSLQQPGAPAERVPQADRPRGGRSGGQREPMRLRFINDGDTVTCVDGSGREVKIRLVGIDAPEMAQDYGRASAAALEEKLRGGNLSVEGVSRDRFGRLLGTLFIDERNINLEMVAEGHAWAFDYADDSAILAAERDARRGRLGLWADPAPESPARWRDAHPREP